MRWIDAFVVAMKFKRGQKRALDAILSSALDVTRPRGTDRAHQVYSFGGLYKYTRVKGFQVNSGRERPGVALEGSWHVTSQN